MPSAENIVQRYCAEQADHLDSALSSIVSSDQAVHDARVACRRLTTAFRLAEGCFKPARVKLLRRRVKDVLRLLGAIRDAEVLVQHVAGFAAVADATRSRSLRFLESSLARKKSRILRVLQRKRYAALPREIKQPATYAVRSTAFQAANTGKMPVPRSGPGGAFAFLRKRLEKLETWRRRGDGPERLHRLRIQFKKLRYTAEYFELFEPRLRKLSDFARRFQNILGDYHDAVVLEHELERAARDHGDELLRSAMDSARADQHALKARFRKLWSRRRIKRLRKEIEERQQGQG